MKTPWRIHLVNAALMVALCVSAAYWASQWRTPAAQSVVAAPQIRPARVDIASAAKLFGGRPVSARKGRDFQLRGVVVAGNPADSIAIMKTDDGIRVLPVNAEIVSGVKITEVHRRYVMLADGGEMRRIELPERAREAESGKVLEKTVGPNVNGRSDSERKPDLTRQLARARHG
jgi:general secretion pathway protein C